MRYVSDMPTRKNATPIIDSDMASMRPVLAAKRSPRKPEPIVVAQPENWRTVASVPTSAPFSP